MILGLYFTKILLFCEKAVFFARNHGLACKNRACPQSRLCSHVRSAVKPGGGGEGKFEFIGEFFLCTFLSLSRERCPKNATKGLGTLWTPVSPLWVCLTEEIHGGGFEKRSA